ncbi:MAG: glycosyltransferase [Candidatus Nanopelagicales bacterium]
MGLPRFDRLRSRGGVLHLSVPGVWSLGPVAIGLVGEARVRGVRVRVGTWRPPKGWVGSPGLAGLSACSLRPRGSGAAVSLSVIEPVDPAILVAAVMRMLRPTHLDAGPLMTICPGLPASAAALASAIIDVLSAGEKPSRHLRRTDTLVAPAVPQPVPADQSQPSTRARTLIISERGWDLDGAAFDIVVDPAVHRPVGRRSLAPGHVSTASIVSECLVIETPGGEVRARGDLSPTDVHRLRPVSAVRAGGILPVRWRAQLEAAGVVVVSDAAAGDLPEKGDDLGWQLASVRARRDALRTHSPAAALNAWPAVSVVLVTHRDRFLAHALSQIARLDYPSMQVVIGLHGVDIDDREVAGLIERTGLRSSPVSAGRREVVVHRIDRDVPFGRAMQAACDRADGVLITKVDDDDHYAPEHVWDLVLARMYSGAQLVGKALDWIHVEADDITAFRPAYPAESYATFVAGGTMLISKADLLEAGGWRPVAKSIDRALIEQVKRIGGLVYRTHGLGYVYVRHGEAHTAIVSDEHFLTENVGQWPGLIAHDAFGTAPA